MGKAFLLVVFLDVGVRLKPEIRSHQRTGKHVPTYCGPGTHVEVEYVLLQDGYTIYASCDTTTLNTLGPDATCGFRPPNTYNRNANYFSSRVYKRRRSRSVI